MSGWLVSTRVRGQFEFSSTGLNKAGVNTTSDWSTFCCHYKHKVKKKKKCWGLVKFMLPKSTETQRLFSLGNLCFYCTLFCRQHPSSFVTKFKSNIKSPSLSSYQVYSWYNCIHCIHKNHHLTHITSFHSIHVCPDWERLVTRGNNDRLKLIISNIKQLVVNCTASDIDIVTTTKKETYQWWNINSSQRCSTQQHRRCTRSGQFQGGRPRLVSPIQCLTDCKIWSQSHIMMSKWSWPLTLWV